jgi:hypothetical protein
LVNDARAEVAGTEQKVQAFKVPMKWNFLFQYLVLSETEISNLIIKMSNFKSKQ